MGTCTFRAWQAEEVQSVSLLLILPLTFLKSRNSQGTRLVAPSLRPGVTGVTANAERHETPSSLATWGGPMALMLHRLASPRSKTEFLLLCVRGEGTGQK